MSSPLFLQTEPVSQESAGSYILRCASLNRTTVRRMYGDLGLRWHGDAVGADIDTFGAATVAGSAWLRRRVAQPPLEVGRWRCEWSGHAWRTPDLFVRKRCRICAACVHATGFARLEWQLAFYAACPIHRRALTTVCPHCKHTFTWDRPAVDVCRCRRHVGAVGDEDRATERVCGLLAWVSRSLHDADVMPEMPEWLDRLLPGRPSIDGVWRTVWAFGLRPEATDAHLDVFETPTPNQILGVLRRGLDRLALLGRLDFPRKAVHVEALRLQHLRGVCPADRALARHLLGRVGVEPSGSWRRQGVQLELFS
jgi:hypothetical protein